MDRGAEPVQHIIIRIGQYDATKQPAIVNVDEEKALAWLAKGAQPTDTVRSLFKKQGVMQKFADAKK
ncbi:30S ribosomal protein S16 [Veillonella sp.]|uniref:small ribosomal subunit protein bS16 n=1 Tax=Veillonella sp. TaxID=1926307 RepID=UPI0039670762